VAYDPKPDARIHVRQPAALEQLRAGSAHSYFLFGETGTHKTSFAVALMQEAGRRGQLVNFAVGKTCIDDIRNYQLNRIVPQNRTFYSLEQLETDEPLCLVIDELDDTLSTFSSYTISTLFAITEAVQAYRHQLLITSNDDLETVLENWCARDAENKYNTINYAKKDGTPPEGGLPFD
jgi:DNA replication protein DnaC